MANYQLKHPGAVIDDAIDKALTALQADTVGSVLQTAKDSGEFDGVGIQTIGLTRSPDEDGYYYIILNLTDGQQQTIPYKNGKDGVSPSVSVTSIPGGNRVSITDANGTKTFDVMNGGEISDTKLADAIASYIAENPIEGGSNVPDYVTAEADRVADAIQAVRTANSLVLLCASDIHTLKSNAQSVESTLHLAQGMNEICKRIAVDGIAILGDSAFGSSTSTAEETKFAFTHLRKNLAKGETEIWIPGNHDHRGIDSDGNYLSADELYNYIGANTTDRAVVDYDNIHRMYGYVDYSRQRIRVIYLNTSDITDSYTTDYGMSNAQGQWFVDALSSVQDGWGVVVMSHHPLNGSTVTGLLTILDAYKGKQSGSVTIGDAIPYNFTATKGELICHLHGHIHNYQVKTLGTNGVLSITIPNGYFWRNNEYGQAGNTEWGDEVDGAQRVINKTAGTAEDTAYTAVVIDRKNGKIHALRCGAGIDRTCDYANVEPEQPETITIEWKDGYRFSSSSGGQSAQTGMTCGYLTMTDLAVGEGYRVSGIVFDNAAHANTYCTAYENDAYTSKNLALSKGLTNAAFATYYTISTAADGSYFEIFKTSAPTDGKTLKVGVAGYGSGANAVVTRVNNI